MDKIVVVVDRSGSMDLIKSDAEGGVNSFINEQKEIGEAELTFVEFDENYDMLAENVNIKEFKEYKLVPRGMTALFDAIGRTANAVKDSNVTGKKIFVVVTDGQENRSTEWKNASAISSLISEMRENKWEFIFIGSDEKSLSEAKSLGMDMGKAFSFGGTSRGISDSYDAVSVYATSFRSGASSEEADKKLADIVSSSSTLKQ